MTTLSKRLDIIKKRIGNTPLVALEHPYLDLRAKLEFHNFVGSIKDRVAFNILREAIMSGEVDEDTTVIEASSGNFAMATAAICKFLNLKFIAVVDPNVNQVYQALLGHFAHEVVVVDKKDRNDGYLLTKLDYIKNFCNNQKKAFWTNQYENPKNLEAHFWGTGLELVQQASTLDYVFLAVATGGTIAGISRRVKETNPDTKVIAVDVDGSVIFGRPAAPRYIPGMGSGIVPHLITQALIDDVVYVSEQEEIRGCFDLFNQYGLFVGGSSGSVFAAIGKYFTDYPSLSKPTVAFVCPDRGTGYADNIYNASWRAWHRHKMRVPHSSKPEPVAF